MDFQKQYYSWNSCKKAYKQYPRHIEDEMKINKVPSLLAQCNFAVAECNAVSTYCVPASKPAWPAKAYNKEKEVDNNMTTYNEIEASRRYLNQRVESVRYNKNDELRSMFNMDKSSIPANYKQLIDAIKNDKYTLNTKRIAKIDQYIEEDDYYGNAFDGIIFKLDSAPDVDGCEVALKELDKKIQSVKDTINVSTPADGLKALQELEAWTYVGKAS